MTDQLSPNYLEVNADGTIGAEFTGIVKALGVTLAAGSGSTPQSPNIIKWTRQAGLNDGALVAELYATDDSETTPGGYTQVGFSASDNNNTGAYNALSAANTLGSANGADSARLTTHSGVQNANASKVYASAIDSAGNTHQVDIIRADGGQSDFLQKANNLSDLPNPDTGWIPVTLLNGYTSHIPTPPRYRRDALGFVHLYGRINVQSTGGGIVMFTLPNGFIPTDSTISAAGYNGTTAIPAFLDFDASGNVYPYVGSGYVAGATDIGIACILSTT